MDRQATALTVRRIVPWLDRSGHVKAYDGLHERRTIYPSTETAGAPTGAHRKVLDPTCAA